MEETESKVLFKTGILPEIRNWDVIKIDELIRELTMYREKRTNNKRNSRRPQQIGIGLADAFRENLLIKNDDGSGSSSLSMNNSRKDLINAAMSSARRYKEDKTHMYHCSTAQHRVNGQLTGGGPPAGYVDPVDNFDPDKLYHLRSKAIQEMLDSPASVVIASSASITEEVNTSKKTGPSKMHRADGISPTFSRHVQPIYSPIGEEVVVKWY